MQLCHTLKKKTIFLLIMLACCIVIIFAIRFVYLNYLREGTTYVDDTSHMNLLYRLTESMYQPFREEERK